MLDDNGFQKGLMDFPLGEDVTSVLPEHRDKLIPVVLRLLFGRMKTTKGTKDKGKGKDLTEKRRNQVFHYIMALSEEHIKYFLDIIYADLYTGCDLGSSSIYEYILAGKPAPRKGTKEMQFILNTTKCIMLKLEQLMNKNLDYVLETILWIGYQVDTVYRETGSVATVKTARKSVYELLALFCELFPKFEFGVNAEKVMFQCFIWKGLENFEKEFIQSPSGILSILLTWAKQRKFHR